MPQSSRPLPALILAAVAAALALPAAAQRLSEERGYDYRGGDYSDFRSRGVDSCKAECRDDRRCQAYSYNLRTSTCYLKDRVGDFQRNSDTVAGVKEGGGFGPGRPYGPGTSGDLSEEEGYDYRGGDYSDFRSRGVDSCKAECRRDRRCRAYSYNLRTGTCYLKDRVGSLRRNSDTVAGVKGGDGGGYPGYPGGGYPGRPGLSEERGWDHRGGDYDEFRARGVDDCKDQCRDEARCQAYSFNLRTSTCYLKDRVGSLERNSDTVTGSKDAGSGSPGYPGSGGGDGFREYDGFDVRGGDYQDFRARGPEACRAECRRDRRCRAYTFNLRTGTCYLKDGPIDLERRSDTVSGIREGGGG